MRTRVIHCARPRAAAPASRHRRAGAGNISIHSSLYPSRDRHTETSASIFTSTCRALDHDSSEKRRIGESEREQKKTERRTRNTTDGTKRTERKYQISNIKYRISNIDTSTAQPAAPRSIERSAHIDIHIDIAVPASLPLPQRRTRANGTRTAERAKRRTGKESPHIDASTAQPAAP